MSRLVKYADPYPVISTITPSPSSGSRTMKSVTNKQLLVNEPQRNVPIQVQVVHRRPKFSPTYNAISGVPFKHQDLFYLENTEKESTRIPYIPEQPELKPVLPPPEPTSEMKTKGYEVLVSGELVPKSELSKQMEKMVDENISIDEYFEQNPELDEMTGEGLGDFFKGIKDTAAKVVDSVSNTAKAIFKGQSRLQPPERKLMEQYGDKVITKIVIQRAPIKTVPVDTLMNLITKGNFNKSLKEYGYDKLFHLFMVITLEDQTEISLEKNETIQMKKSPTKSDFETLNVSLSGKVITLNELMEKTSNLMGSNFFPYHPINNNCQTFISGVMKAIGLNTSQIDTFVNQPVEKLFETYDKSGKLTSWMSKITQLGTKMNFLKRGGKIHHKMHS